MTTSTAAGRVALVTGGSRGIGLACARALAAAGNQVAVTHRTSPAPEGLLAVEADVADPASVDAAVDQVEARLGPVQVLVAAAGIGPTAPIVRLDDAHLDEVLGTNVAGVLHACRRVASGMARGRWGRIVLVSSISAAYGAAGVAAYAGSKAALVGVARSLARELGPRGVTTNVVAPGQIDTGMLESAGADLREAGLALTPLGRVGRPEEVAAAVRFLVSEDAAYVNGVVLPVDGGVAMGR